MPLLRLGAKPMKTYSVPSELTPELVIRAVYPILSDQRRRRIERVARERLSSVTVVLENLYNPHNGAAVLRTCEALGLLHVHVVEGGEAFRFSRKVSAHAHNWLNVYIHASIRSCMAWLHQRGFVCWATVPPDRVQGAEGDPRVRGDRPAALVFGNEHAGLSPEAISLCDGRFTIPMQGFTESLNLSVSAALALHPTVVQRRAFLGRPGDLDADSLIRLRAAYYARSTAHAVPLILRHLRRRSVERWERIQERKR